MEADVEQAEATLKARQAQVDNLRAGIEQDIEDALLDIKAAAQQVEVARTGLDYAQQTLEQSQDRFAAGVTNNVEVIQAQQQLASANEQYIDSLYAYNIAKVLLARAIGNAEQAVKQYLVGAGKRAAGESGNAAGSTRDADAGNSSQHGAGRFGSSGRSWRPSAAWEAVRAEVRESSRMCRRLKPAREERFKGW